MAYQTRVLPDGRARSFEVFAHLGEVPFCAYEECGQYDGKRCRELGAQPHSICEPEVSDLLSELSLLRKGFR